MNALGSPNLNGTDDHRQVFLSTCVKELQREAQEQLRLRYFMGAGGTAPKMKMNEVFILTGTTLLLGALFMQAWVTPVVIEQGGEPYLNGASMMSGDAFQIELTVENETTVRVVFYDESDTILSAESIVMAAGQTVSRTLEAEKGGYYTYEVDTKGVEATLNLDVERKLMIDLLPFPIGGLLLAFGLYQRQAVSDEEEDAKTTPSIDEVLDADLDV